MDLTEDELRTVNPSTPVNRGREVQVTGTAEVCCPADRASVRVSVGSDRESVEEVTSSVSRRLDYILQAVRQHGVGDDEASVGKFLRREADRYRMDAEVLVTFSDFERMERVYTVLLEKLDKSVLVGSPHFYHSNECRIQARQRAFLSAVESAQHKANKVGKVFGQTLGPPLLVREEETKEWRNEEEAEDRGQGAALPPCPPRIPTITASSRVSVSFSLRDGRRIYF